MKILSHYEFPVDEEVSRDERVEKKRERFLWNTRVQVSGQVCSAVLFFANPRHKQGVKASFEGENQPVSSWVPFQSN